MSRPRRRALFGALILGALFAIALEVVWPGAWRWGSTPRFVLTLVLAVIASAALVRTRRS
jgi:predicted membrane channel-forming protein YqfA (hemolysin III family)